MSGQQVMSAPQELVAFRKYVKANRDASMPLMMFAGREGVTLHIHKMPSTETLNAILVFIQTALAEGAAGGEE
jgi:hypothetical protein